MQNHIFGFPRMFMHLVPVSSWTRRPPRTLAAPPLLQCRIMKLAFSTNAFSRHPLPYALEAIAAAGYKAVEILADKPHWYPGASTFADAQAIRAQLDQLGLAVSNINANCTFGYWQDP